jgi:hypothetical protein
MRPYIKDEKAFSPEAVSAMGAAFQGALDDLKIAEDAEAKRAAVAQFILEYAQLMGFADTTKMRRVAVVAFSRAARKSAARSGPSSSSRAA